MSIQCLAQAQNASVSNLYTEIFAEQKWQYKSKTTHRLNNSALYYLSGQFKLLTQKNSSKIQSLIDETALKIFNTPLKKTFCQLSGGSAQQLQIVFAISTKMANQLVLNCKVNKKYFINKRIPQRQFIISIIKDYSYPLGGWTDMVQKSVLLFTPQTFTKENFLKKYLHEIAISLDMKAEFISKSFEIYFNKKIQFTSKNYIEIYSALNHPVIKMLLTATRSFQVERLILQELYPKQNVLTPWPSSSNTKCIKNLEELLPSILQLAPLFQTHLLFYYYLVPSYIDKSLMPDEDQKLYKKDPIELLKILTLAQKSSSFIKEYIKNKNPHHAALNIRQALKILKTTSILELATNKTVSLCQYFSKPLLGYPLIQHRNFGPRPRIGGTWGDDIVKKIKNSKNTKEEFNFLLW
ncbi:MAG: hypothetical protein HAW60_02735 [Bdellovibrionales bacterium]|nr:hypothetical protein [Bdellovibrionales bacterium]